MIEFYEAENYIINFEMKNVDAEKYSAICDEIKKLAFAKVLASKDGIFQVHVGNEFLHNWKSIEYDKNLKYIPAVITCELHESTLHVNISLKFKFKKPIVMFRSERFKERLKDIQDIILTV